MNGNPATPAKPKSVVYASSGYADAGELADRIAVGLAAAKELISTKLPVETVPENSVVLANEIS